MRRPLELVQIHCRFKLLKLYNFVILSKIYGLWVFALLLYINGLLYRPLSIWWKSISNYHFRSWKSQPFGSLALSLWTVLVYGLLYKCTVFVNFLYRRLRLFINTRILVQYTVQVVSYFPRDWMENSIFPSLEKQK